MPSLSSRLRSATRRWARRRHGVDSAPTTLSGRRIYIVPTGLGIAFGLMIFAMFLGAMNYANNLALGACFHARRAGTDGDAFCHRNLAGVHVLPAASEPVFAGQSARFRISLENPRRLARHELTIANDFGAAPPVRVNPGERAVVEVELPAPHRGWLSLEYLQSARVIRLDYFAPGRGCT